MGPASGHQPPSRSYPKCTFFEVPSNITHVLPRADAAECFVRPPQFFEPMRSELGLSPCVLTKKCKCCSIAGPGADFSRCEDLTYGDLRLVNLEGANMDNVDLTCASFEGANLKGASYRDAVGWHTNFAGSNLEGTEFAHATLPHSKFVRASLVGAKFEYSKLDKAIFDSSVIQGASFKFARVFQTSWLKVVGAHTADFTMAEQMTTSKGLEKAMAAQLTG